MIDIEELKKLPTHVKVDLIDQLLHSIDDSEDDSIQVEENSELLKEMEQRLDDMRTGKMETYSWEDAKKMILEDLKIRRATNV